MALRARCLLAQWLVACGLVMVSPARAADAGAEGFVQQQHERIEGLLHQPASPSRDAQVRQALGQFVDFDGLAQRAFGEPCPSSEPSCEDLWSSYTGAQRAEVRGLLERLVRKTYENNLLKTLDYDVQYRGSREGAEATRVMTEAKSRANPREPPVRVEYVVTQTAQGLRVVDIVTEGSSLTKNYYDQFRKKIPGTRASSSSRSSAAARGRPRARGGRRRAARRPTPTCRRRRETG
jgi:phospholipid transport system substrate-binding protein